MTIENNLADETEFTGISDHEPKLDLGDVEKYASFALIKKKSFLGFVYFLEKRQHDDTLANKLGLFGGSRSEASPEVSHENILNRELGEELGLSEQRAGFNSKLYAKWRRENGGWTAIEVFFLEERHTKYIRYKKLLAARKERAKLDPDDKFGIPIKIRRVGLNWWWFRGWHKLTPVASFALLADWREDLKAHEAGKK